MVHTAAQAQVDVGQSSSLRKLVPAESLEESAKLQYRQTLGEASSKGALAPDDYPQLKRLRTIANALRGASGGLDNADLISVRKDFFQLLNIFRNR